VEFEVGSEAADTGCPLSPPVTKAIPLIEEVGGRVAQQEEEEEEKEKDRNVHFKRKRKDTSPRGAPKKKKKKAVKKVTQSSFPRYIAQSGTLFVEKKRVPPYILIAISPIPGLHDIWEFIGETTSMLASDKGGFTFLHFHSSRYRELISFLS